MTGWPDFITGITPSAEYSSNQTLASSTNYALVDASTRNVTITLPAAADNERTVFTIKKIDSSNHRVTIDANGTETIDGELTVDLKLQYSYITIVCDGTEWFIIGGEYVKMEDTLEDIKKVLDNTLENQEKLLVKIGEIEKHQAEGSELDIDQEEVEEKLRDMMVEVND